MLKRMSRERMTVRDSDVEWMKKGRFVTVNHGLYVVWERQCLRVLMREFEAIAERSQGPSQEPGCCKVAEWPLGGLLLAGRHKDADRQGTRGNELPALETRIRSEGSCHFSVFSARVTATVVRAAGQRYRSWHWSMLPLKRLRS